MLGLRGVVREPRMASPRRFPPPAVVAHSSAIERTMAEIFLSYVSSDRAFVRRLYDDLRRRVPEHQVWFDVESIKAGSSWAKSLTDGIGNAETFIAVVSPSYLETAWAKRELAIAVANKKRVVPVLVGPCRPTGHLAQLQWVDFTKDYGAAFEKLIWAITGERPQGEDGKRPGDIIAQVDPRELEAVREESSKVARAFEAGTTTPPVEEKLEERKRKRRCFIVMPFGDRDLQDVYELYVKPTLEQDCALECKRADDIFGSDIIMDDILRSIKDADVSVADLTHQNANVFYEVGIAHALQKPVLLLAQAMEELPFDLRHRRVLVYDTSPRGCKFLPDKLIENMQSMLAEL
jgi:hypothetical protein